MKFVQIVFVSNITHEEGSDVTVSGRANSLWKFAHDVGCLHASYIPPFDPFLDGQEGRSRSSLGNGVSEHRPCILLDNLRFIVRLQLVGRDLHVAFQLVYLLPVHGAQQIAKNREFLEGCVNGDVARILELVGNLGDKLLGSVYYVHFAGFSNVFPFVPDEVGQQRILRSVLQSGFGLPEVVLLAAGNAGGAGTGRISSNILLQLFFARAERVVRNDLVGIHGIFADSALLDIRERIVVDVNQIASGFWIVDRGQRFRHFLHLC